MNLKNLVVYLFLLCIPATAFCNLTGLSADQYQINGITGTITWRIYAEFDDPNDRLIAMYGLDTDPLQFQTTTSFYQDGLGGALSSDINAALFGVFPDLEWDSWLTIGAADNAGNTLASIGFDYTQFELGNDFIVNDIFGGSIFLLPGDPNTVPVAGRVLIGQLTSDGDLDLLVNLQWRDATNTAIDSPGLTLNLVASIPGCTDPNATNYNPAATIDDGSCTYPAPSYSGLTFETEAVGGVPGMTTYRVYANFTNPFDQLTAVYGQDLTPLTLDVTTSFYQDAAGGPRSSDILPALYGSNPQLIYDSWITIGTEESPNQLQDVNVDYSAFEAGGNWAINDPVGGSWFVFPDTEPSAFPDGSGRVLIAQVTTDGIVDMCVNLQYRAQDGTNPQELAQCITFPTAIPGCTNPVACNYNPAATVDDGSCLFLDACGVCGGAGTVAGCTTASACNYNPAADCDDGSCLTLDACGVCGGAGTVAGCTTASACNYNPAADCDDGSCLTLDACGVCGGAGTVAGCTTASACNYNPAADCDDGSCLTLDACGVCGGAGTVAGCTTPSACNYNPAADCDDGSCLTLDACGVCGGAGTVAGCTTPSACNYNPAADCDDGSCLTLDACGVCGGAGTVAGCTTASACNYNPAADCDDGSCTVDDECGVCGGVGVAGCTNPTACNYSAAAACDDGTCILPDGCTDPLACNYDPAATCDDGSCTASCPGCTYPDADNYDPTATLDDGSCIFTFDCPGCTDPTALNYNPGATSDDGSCIPNIPGCTDGQSINYDPTATVDDGSCIAIVFGCTDPAAFNFDPAANTDNGGCIAVALGCIDPAFDNYNPYANTDDGSCSDTCFGDSDGNGVINTIDLLSFLSVFGTNCP